MAHYRKIETCIWNDQKFNGLSPDGKLIFLFLLTHPNLTVLGAMRLSAMGIAGELKLPFERVEMALDALTANQMVQYEAENVFIWLPQFLKYNPPESPNVVKSWSSAISYLPEGELKNALMRDARDRVLQLGQGFQEALPPYFFQLPTAHGISAEKANVHRSSINHLAGQAGEGGSIPPIQTPPQTPGTSPPQTPPSATEQRTVSNQHHTISSQLEEMNQANHSNQTNNSGEINTLVAPLLQKNTTLFDECHDLVLPWQSVQDALPYFCQLPMSHSISMNNRVNQAEEGGSIPHLQTPPQTPPQTPGTPPPQTPPQTPPAATEQRTVSNQHKAMSIKLEAMNQENDSNKKNNRGEINTIVAPTRHKKSKPPDGEVVEVFRYWQATLGHPQAQLDTNRRQCIGKALASGYSVAQLCEAIRGCSLTPHNLGDNDQGQRYDGLHVILRHADQIDRFIRNAHSPPRRLTQADRLWADNEAAGERWRALYAHDDEEKVIHATD